VKAADLKQALDDLGRAGAALHQTAANADEVPVALLAECIVAISKAARRLTRLREQLTKGGRRERA
jgi:hypothetical protein